MELNKDIEAGTIINITEGEYSDFHVLGTFRVLKKISLKRMLAICRTVEEISEDDFGLTYKTIDYLQGFGYVEEINNRTIHLGSYGQLGPILL